MPLLAIEGDVCLRIVLSYRHLGSCISVSESLSEDVACRCSAARTTTSALTRHLYGKVAIAEQARTMAVVACSHSRFSYLSGCWPSLSEVQLLKWGAEFCRPLRAICVRPSPS